MYLNKLFDFTVDARNLCNFEDGGSLILVLVENGLDEQLQVSTCSFGERLTLLIDDHVEHGLDTLTIEGLLQSDQLIDDYSHCPDIGFGIICLTFTNLGRHKIWSSTFCLSEIIYTCQSLGNTEIS